MAKRSLGRPEEALEDIDKWFELAGTCHPDQYLHLLVKAGILIDLGNFAEAERLFREIMRYAPTIFAARGFISCLVQDGKIDEARAEVTRFKERYPEESLAKTRASFRLSLGDRGDIMADCLQQAGLE